jgi:PEP-CTERM motif
MEINMRTLYSFAIFFLTAAPAFAQIVGDDTIQLPEPEVLSLIGIGALAFLVGRRGKK